MSFALNTKIDIFFDTSQEWGDDRWYIGTIVDINKNELEIHYDIHGDDHEDDEWINKTSDRLAGLHTHTLQCISLPGPPIAASATSCVYYKHEHKYYILLCIHVLFAIHRYNVMDSKWEHFCDYPQQLKPYGGDQISIDPINLILYIMDTHHICTKYANLDIVSREWAVYSITNQMLNLPQFGFYRFIFIPFPTKSLYFNILFNMKHIYQIIDNQENDKTLSVNHVTHDLSEGIRNVIWCQELSKIISLNNQKIFHCNINDNGELKNLKWKIYGFQLDRTDTYEYRLIIGYKHILFVFSNYFDEIYCIDLLYEKMYKSHKSSVQTSMNALIVKGNGDYIYVIDCGLGRTQRISLLDIFPNDLICFYKNKIGNPLIFGYISEFNKKNQLSDFVPFDIANLILNFYPLFLESC